MKKKDIWLVIALIYCFGMVVFGVCGMLFVWYLNGAVLSDPIEFTVSSRYLSERDFLCLKAVEFDRPEFFAWEEEDKRLIQENISDGDKISVRVYDYNRGESSYTIIELQKDGEILFVHPEEGDGGRGAYIGLGVVSGVFFLLSILFTVLMVREGRKNKNLRNNNE